MAGKIFISYRRKESRKDARFVFNHLAAEWGRDRIFMDVHDIRPGYNFREVLQHELTAAKVLLALIGPDWLGARDDDGRRKLDLEDDFVRMEIRAALDRKIRVIPICLDGAQMPRPAVLPADIRELAGIHKLDVDVADEPAFERAMAVLMDVIREEIQEEASPDVDPFLLAYNRAKGDLPAWAANSGDDAHGRWADLRIDQVTQRFRWIEPGEFWMGSTEAERKRFLVDVTDKSIFDNEAPRQRVQITQGFWLADTACTQALWQAVLGDNPSEFTGDLQLPVEQVSWTDVAQRFLPALNARLHGTHALLPTEAQWEYACRAGTDTAYSFGELITPAQVNYDGNYPPPGGQKGEVRKRTVPVNDLSMNAWGLYQMHGNVGEWCADWEGPYVGRIAKDPMGPQEGDRRVLRGGSWHHRARGCRSARRLSYLPGYKGRSVGFRLALGLPEAVGRLLSQAHSTLVGMRFGQTP